MLIHMYNGKKCQEYVKEYKNIIEIVTLSIENNFFICSFPGKKRCLY